MDEIGLFPLGLVLLPTEHVPLHIFEPRYRELVGESLEQGTPFGVVYADDDGLRQVGTLASVTEVVVHGLKVLVKQRSSSASPMAGSTSSSKGASDSG